MRERRLNRPVSLRFMAGGMNFTPICTWLAREVYDRSPGTTQSTIRLGRGYADNVRAVACSEVDVSIVTPAALADRAVRGAGPFTCEAYPYLRALAALPHPDRLLLAVSAQMGVSSVAELRERRAPLRLSISADDGVNFAGYAARRVLEASGLPVETVRSWGGTVIEHESSFDCLAEVAEGRADAILHEAVMAEPWHRVAESQDLTCLSLEPDVLAKMEAELGCAPVQLPAGYLPGLDQPVDTLTFSGYLVLVREDMPDDVADVLTGILTEGIGDFVADRYGHLPAEHSPIPHPVERERLAQTPIALHPAAAALYAASGWQALEGNNHG